MAAPLLELDDIRKEFGQVIALDGVSFSVQPGQCHCLLGDNGAGKSTLIKVMSGVHGPTRGRIVLAGRQTSFATPRQAMAVGVATVYQDLSLIPLMSVTRNFWMGREPVRRWGPIPTFDIATANEIVMEEMARFGIQLREPSQAVGTLSGGERQIVAIARAAYFGAKVLILDEPTSALGVRQTENVLQTIDVVRKQGVAVVFISHNVRHAMSVGDRFTVLNRGRTIGTAGRGELDEQELRDLMSGGIELKAFDPA
ncbi:MAG: ATP-binding cassette domain-containing protein [Pseudomonadota bacterium]